MDCCTAKAIEGIFGERMARHELKDYWKHGLDKTARRLVEAVKARGVSGAAVLEVGGGVGGVHVELLKAGAARAVDVDLSPSYLDAARSVAEKAGVLESVEYHHADFAEEAQSVSPADIVVLHRVVCCYPDMPALITAAAGHARRVLALSAPRVAWYTRLFGAIVNAGMWVTRSAFRLHLHSHEAIVRTAERAGHRLTESRASFPWQIMLFESRQTSSEVSKISEVRAGV